jgi:hypothetical protein
MDYPEPSFAHVRRLSDDVGLLEHARGAMPRRKDGYCVDDVAHGLVAIFREPDLDPGLLALGERYLMFVAHAQMPDGGFHNRLGYDRRWHGEPGVGDWWGRALWGLGTTIARSPLSWHRDEALACFEIALQRRSARPRAMAFAALGAHEVLTVMPEHSGARRLLTETSAAIGPSGLGHDWPWPEPRLTYANAVLAEGLIIAGTHLGRPAAAARGHRLLAWLLERQTTRGHLSVVPAGGLTPTGTTPAFDQQPIEVATLADACATAYATTGDPQWREGVRLAADWFLGENDSRTEMLDRATGGAFDGLTATGHNANQGAESTLALIITLQHARRMCSPAAGVSIGTQDSIGYHEN